jgi:hypothetical protein
MMTWQNASVHLEQDTQQKEAAIVIWQAPFLFLSKSSIDLPLADQSKSQYVY